MCVKKEREYIKRREVIKTVNFYQNLETRIISLDGQLDHVGICAKSVGLLLCLYAIFSSQFFDLTPNSVDKRNSEEVRITLNHSIMSLEELEKRVSELEEKVSFYEKQNGLVTREKIDEMSSEVVDSNPYR